MRMKIVMTLLLCGNVESLFAFPHSHRDGEYEEYCTYHRAERREWSTLRKAKYCLDNGGKHSLIHGFPGIDQWRE